MMESEIAPLGPASAMTSESRRMPERSQRRASPRMGLAGSNPPAREAPERIGTVGPEG